MGNRKQRRFRGGVSVGAVGASAPPVSEEYFIMHKICTHSFNQEYDIGK